MGTKWIFVNERINLFSLLYVGDQRRLCLSTMRWKKCWRRCQVETVLCYLKRSCKSKSSTSKKAGQLSRPGTRFVWLLWFYVRKQSFMQILRVIFYTNIIYGLCWLLCDVKSEFFSGAQHGARIQFVERTSLYVPNRLAIDLHYSLKELPRNLHALI